MIDSAESLLPAIWDLECKIVALVPQLQSKRTEFKNELTVYLQRFNHLDIATLLLYAVELGYGSINFSVAEDYFHLYSGYISKYLIELSRVNELMKYTQDYELSDVELTIGTNYTTKCCQIRLPDRIVHAHRDMFGPADYDLTPRSITSEAIMSRVVKVLVTAIDVRICAALVDLIIDYLLGINSQSFKRPVLVVSDTAA
jgi:hypothetical protein